MSPEHASATSPRHTTGIAAFDFDGTLARGDNFVPFLVAVVGRGSVARAFAAASRASFPAGRGQRERLKLELCRTVFVGRYESELREIGRRYAEYIHQRGLRPDVVERLRWHQYLGHHTVIVSASLDLYLAPLAERLGIDGLECTSLDFVDGVATGRLAAGNCRGQEKARRMRTHMAQMGIAGPLWAYGDNAGDHELLAMADHPTRVGRRPLGPGGLGPWDGRR